MFVPSGGVNTERTGGIPGICKGFFPANTQVLRDLDLPEEDIRVLSKITSEFHVDLHGVDKAFEDMQLMGLSDEKPLSEAKTKGTQLRLPQERANGRGTAGVGRAGLPQARSGDR